MNRKQAYIFDFSVLVFMLACQVRGLAGSNLSPLTTPTLQVVKFNTATPTLTASPTLMTSPTPTSTPTHSPTPTPTDALMGASTPTSPPPSTPTPSPTPAPVKPTNTPPPASPPKPAVDFALRLVRMRTNKQNSWDGTLGPGQCGSDHSIYVHVADKQENLLNDILVGDKYGNFEVPTGVDGPGVVRILVWSATMELAVMGHKDGTRYTSDFTPPLSTVDEQIPLDWLQQAGYCKSPEDCKWRVENNQLCRGHYSYDVIFQRTW